MPGDRRQQVRVGQGAPSRDKRPEADRLAHRRFRNLSQRPGVGERVDGGQAFGLVNAFEGIERDVAQHGQRLVPHTRIGVVASDDGQGRRIQQLGDRGAAHPDVFVFARGGDDEIALGERKLRRHRPA